MGVLKGRDQQEAEGGSGKAKQGAHEKETERGGGKKMYSQKVRRVPERTTQATGGGGWPERVARTWVRLEGNEQASSKKRSNAKRRGGKRGGDRLKTLVSTTPDTDEQKWGRK